jgi:hypothetical protein
LDLDVATAKKTSIKITNLKTKKVSEVYCLMIGIFDTSKNVFMFSSYKDVIYENLIKRTDYFHDSLSTLKKLFSNRTINITKEKHYIIPYLHAILAPNKLNVVRFTSNSFIGYCLIELNYPLTLYSFEKDLNSYRYYLELAQTLSNKQKLSRPLSINKQNMNKQNMTNKSHKYKDIKKFVSRMKRTKLIKFI